MSNTLGMVTASSLPHRVKIQQRADTDDTGGGTTIVWSDIATVWASVMPGSGREFLAAKQEVPELSHMVTIRYRTGVTPKHRLILRGETGARAFNVESVVNTEEANVELVLYCSEIVKT